MYPSVGKSTAELLNAHRSFGHVVKWNPPELRVAHPHEKEDSASGYTGPRVTSSVVSLKKKCEPVGFLCNLALSISPVSVSQNVSFLEKQLKFRKPSSTLAGSSIFSEYFLMWDFKKLMFMAMWQRRLISIISKEVDFRLHT